MVTGTGANRVLRGWRDIAAYVGCTIRCVQKWAAERGLPVAVLGIGRRPTALISTAVFDLWLMQQSTTFKKWKRGQERNSRTTE